MYKLEENFTSNAKHMISINLPQKSYPFNEVCKHENKPVEKQQ